MFQKIINFFVITNVDEGISYEPTTAGNITLFVIIALLFIGMAAFSGRKKEVKVKQLIFSAIALTLAVVASMFHLPSMPNGGSISLFRMFFICFIGYLYGTRAGIMTGIAYGLLDLILGPYVIHPVQLLLDYPIAFGGLGLAGVFTKTKHGIIKGYILGTVARYVCHVISGVIFFAEYAGGENVVLYSLGYSASYIIPEAVISILIISIPAVSNALVVVKKMALEE